MGTQGFMLEKLHLCHSMSDKRWEKEEMMHCNRYLWICLEGQQQVLLSLLSLFKKFKSLSAFHYESQTKLSLIPSYHLIPAPAMTGMSFTKPGCSMTHPAWSWTPSGMGSPQLLWATWKFSLGNLEILSGQPSYTWIDPSGQRHSQHISQLVNKEGKLAIAPNWCKWIHQHPHSSKKENKTPIKAFPTLQNISSLWHKWW